MTPRSLLLTGFLLCAQACQADPASPAGYRLVWHDEFEKDGLPDPNKWDYEVGFVRNKEAQYYTRARKENCRIEKGVLILEARRENFANPNYTGAKGEGKDVATQPGYSAQANATRASAEYTAPSLITRKKAEWKYGRIEVRAKLPEGRGIWPAIWMLGSNRGAVKWPNCGEIDLLEYVGYAPDVVHANVHMPARFTPGLDDAGRTKAGMKATFPLREPHKDFHLYAMDWDEKRIRISVDGNEYFRYDNPGSGPQAWPFDQPFYLLLNVAVGGTWGGKQGIDPAIFPQRMEVDYVRVYQKF